MDATALIDFTELFGTIVDGIKLSLEQVIPLALPIAGLVICITLGMRLFKRIAR